MAITLDGKVAVVTGGASGIGRAAVEMLAERGAHVVVADLNAEGAERVAHAIRERGGSAVGVRADVTQVADTDAMVAAAVSEFGRLDVLACNAGMARFPRPFEQIDPDEFAQIFRVNVQGVWLCVRSAVGAMRTGGGGSIVVTGSIMGERTRPGFAAYASSKAAANHLARTLALELASDQIRVNAVAPVATDTAMLPHFLGPDNPEGARERFIESIPLGRLAEPGDVAEAICYFASDASRFVTGTVLPIDGGRSI
ncbi:SDR family oxidoreductase [Microbacterium sp. 22303]|uniref:SDR family oxidoreductase n=1 Tax=Microbacterium sp. 22303 TaxID=3453905 RepID=UPI003F851F50